MFATEILVNLCSIMVMDALVSGMRANIGNGSAWAADSSRLNQESGHMEFGNCFRGTAIVVSWTELSVELHTFLIPVINFRGLILLGLHSTVKNAKILAIHYIFPLPHNSQKASCAILRVIFSTLVQ